MNNDFCPNCGHKIDPDSVFCNNCGHSLIDNKNDKNQSNNSRIQSSSEGDNTNYLHKLLFGTVLGLILLIIVGGSWLYINNHNQKQKVITKTVEKPVKVVKHNKKTHKTTSQKKFETKETSSNGIISKSEGLDLLRKAGYDSETLDNPELLNNTDNMTTINTYQDNGSDWTKNTYTLYPKGKQVEIHVQSYEGTNKNDPASFQDQTSPDGPSKTTINR